MSHRVPSILCAACSFHNPDGSRRCFGCNAPLEDDAGARRMITVRRRRSTCERIDLREARRRLARRVRALTREGIQRPRSRDRVLTTTEPRD